MAKAEPFQDLSLRPPHDGEELWRWLYRELRESILEGRLRAGTRLPSTRSLAAQHQLSRGTVTAAFEQLQGEGYIYSIRGGGTYVSGGLPDHLMVAGPERERAALPGSTAELSDRDKAMVEGIPLLPASRSVGKAFRAYEPAIDLFPTNLWARVAGRVIRHAPRSLYGQGSTAGYLPLRKAIAEYLGSARGVRCAAGQIVVTSGAQQALDLIGRLLLDPGDPAWVEDPCYPGALAVLRAAGAKLVSVPVDNEGLNVNAVEPAAPSPRLIYTTPANQFPLGTTMSLDRRLALLQLAAKAGAWVIEDEYDAEYRYSGRPVPALQSLDDSGCVIYVGTFTKMLFNALRLGFLVLPERLVSAFEALRSFVDRHPPTLDQAILAEFILDGHFGHHVRRMRQVYVERMGALKEASTKRLKGLVEVTVATAGMRTTGWLQTGEPDSSVAARAQSLGLEVVPLSSFTLRYSQPPGLILGFAGSSEAELRRGVDVLARVFRG